MTDRRQILAFDALRAAAALLVMFSHVRDVFLTDWRPGFGPAAWIFYNLTSFGHPAVIVFFVLSGFWITKVVVERQAAGTWTWGGYLLDRLTRLWVVLIPALCLGAAADWMTFRVLHFPPPGFGAHSIPPDVESHLSPTWFVANAVFLQGLFAPAFGSNGPLWSLANEFWYYLCFPALHIAVTTRRASVPVVLALGAALLFRPLLPGFVCWLCGSALYLASRRYGALTTPWASLAWIPFAALLVLDRNSGSGARDVALAFACVLPFWQARDWGFGKGAAVAAYGASSSFSLYVVHFPLLALTAAVLGVHERVRPSALSITECLAVGAALTLAAWGFSQVTERHTRSVRQGLAGLGRLLTASRTAPELP
ncbi:MAG: acyltransferase family protein [Caulobacteraceae bacterium]